MGRPTVEAKRHYIGVRLTDSEYEKLGENKSESIRELINGVLQNKSSSVLQNNDGFGLQNDEDFVLQNENSFVEQNDNSDIKTFEDFVKQNEYLDDIRQMVEHQGGTLDDFLMDLDIKLSWETLKMEQGKIVISEIDEEISNLVSACEEKGVSVGEAIRKTAQSIWSMRQ